VQRRFITVELGEGNSEKICYRSMSYPVHSHPNQPDLIISFVEDMDKSSLLVCRSSIKHK